MKLSNVHFLPAEQNLFDLVYPVGSIICLESSTDPNTYFGNGVGTWVLINSNASLKISNDLSSTYTGHSSITVTPSGSFGATTLTGAQSPKLALATLNTSTYQWTSTASGHTHTAASSSYTYNNTTYAWYFDTAGAWYGSAKPNITASTTNYYTLGVTATSALSTILTTQTVTSTHATHTFTQAAVNAAGSHSPSFSACPGTIELKCPGRGLKIWKRVQ